MYDKIMQALRELPDEPAELLGFMRLQDEPMVIILVRWKKEYVCWEFNQHTHGFYFGVYGNTALESFCKRINMVSSQRGDLKWTEKE